MASAPTTDAGSFRDPSGTVIVADGRVFRTIEQSAWEHWDAAWASGVLERMMARGQMVRTWPVALADAPAGVTEGLPDVPRKLVEHDRVPFISYPYEWPFSLLKRAALHHIDLHLGLLDAGFTLSDATAYNVQFQGVTPVFIDVLSVRRYREGEYWAGYKQFCEQFLNPLLLGSIHGIPHFSWFRGTLEGIPVEDLARIVPWRARLSWRMYLHVILHAKMTARGRASEGASGSGAKQRPMNKAGFVWMLKGLRKWIASLTPKGIEGTIWGDYAQNTSYAAGEAEHKRAFVARYVDTQKPADVMDLGCNTGDYSEAALVAGAKRVIGFDFDLGALESAVSRAEARKLDYLPLFLDALNPSPNQGWAQAERKGFQERAKTEGLLALAFLHHVTIGRNVPLPRAVAWLASLAPSGVVEFVPKPDPMVQRMLSQREDIFPDYHIDTFRQALGRHARIVREETVSVSGRTLFEYRR